MECNRDEASRALAIAVEKLGAQDWASAKRFAAKADQLFPNLEGLAQVVAVANVQSRAHGKAEGETNWYEILEVEASADGVAIKKQYRKMALVLHPDKNKFPGAEASFKLIQEAWSVLSDRTKREKFDLLKNMTNSSWRSSNFAPQQQQSSNFPAYQQNFAAQGVFWTRCPFCQIQFQYGIQYLNHNLVCTRCSKDFVAVSVENVFPGRAQRPTRRGGMFFPRRNAAAFAAAAAQAAANAGVDTSDVVQRCFNQAKKERKEKVKEEKIAKSKMEEGSAGRGRRRKGIQTRTRKLDEFLNRYPASNDDPKEFARKVAEDHPVNHEQPKEEPEPVPEEAFPSATGPSGGNAEEETKQAPPESKETESPKVQDETQFQVNAEDQEGKDDDGHQQEDGREENHQNEQSHGKLEVPDSDEELLVNFRRPQRRSLEVPDSEEEDWKPEKPASSQRVPENEKPASEKPAAEEQAPATRRSSRKRNILCYRFDDHGEDDPEKEFPSGKKGRFSSPEDFPGGDDRPPPMEQAFGTYDFDADRTLLKVKKGQVWSVYNVDDSLPSWYAKVTNVKSEQHISAKWLEQIKGKSRDVDAWQEVGHYAPCGDFQLHKDTQKLSLTMLCQEARAEPLEKSKNRWKIYPRSGEVWSLIRGWDRSLLSGKNDARTFVYDFGEVLSDYTPEKGVKVAPLVRREGGGFVREATGKWRHVGEAELMSFAYRVPAVKMAEPPGAWQLDSETFARATEEEE